MLHTQHDDFKSLPEYQNLVSVMASLPTEPHHTKQQIELSNTITNIFYANSLYMSLIMRTGDYRHFSTIAENMAALGQILVDAGLVIERTDEERAVIQALRETLHAQQDRRRLPC